MRTLQEATKAFTPTTEIAQDQKDALKAVFEAYMDLLNVIYTEVPQSADRTVAARKLLESKQVCAQSITHDWNNQEKTSSELS